MSIKSKGHWVRCAWAKFREFAPILTSRGASLVVKGTVYKACVQRVLVYGSETWPMKVEDMQRLGRADSEEQNIKEGAQSFECGRGVRCGETWKTKMVRTSGAQE
jgi:hypothetical protein